MPTRIAPGQISSLGLRAGVWECALRVATPPGRVALTLDGRTVALAELTPEHTPENEGIWRARAPIPAETLAEGAQTYVLVADDGEGTEGPRPGATRLAHLPLLAGEALDHDLRAEIDLLRAEMDLLKRELRRLATGDATAG